MSLVFPAYNPNDASAIYDVLEMLLANEEPPRVDVSRVRSDWLSRPPYSGGRLLIRGKCRAGVGEITGFHVWYVSARYGALVPVSEWGPSVGVGTPILRDAAYDEFSCVTSEPYALNSLGDGWAATYAAALAALS